MTTRPQWRHRLLTHRWLAAVLTGLLLASVLAAPLSSATGPGTGGTVELRTVPATPGVHLSVAGSQVITGAAGTAQVSVADLNQIAHRVTLADPRLNAATTVSVTRVSPDPHLTPHLSRLSVGLALSSTTSLRVSAGTSTVQPDEVKSLRLRSITGNVLTATPGQTVSLLSRRAVLQHGSLTTQDVTWSADRIRTSIAGSVTTAGPRFDPLGHPVWVVRLAPVAGTISVRTVPRLDGVTLGFGDAILATGAKGTGTTSVPDLSVTRTPPTVLSSDTTDATGRVVRVLHVATTGPRVPKQRKLLVAVSVARPVTFRFVDQRGEVIAPERVQQVQLNQDGRTITIQGQQLREPVLLASDQPQRVHDQWQARPLRYTVTAVRVDGVNTVFAGRQRIDPAEERTWQIRLSLYALTVVVHDALLGRQVESKTVLTAPSEAQRSVPVRAGSPARIEALPRGLYELQVAGAAFGGHYSVLVSRDTDADLRVITRGDIALVIAALLMMATAMVFTGRLLSRRAERVRAAGGPS